VIGELRQASEPRRKEMIDLITQYDMVVLPEEPEIQRLVKLYVAEKISMPSNEVFTLFYTNGIIKMLDDDYDILHGHGFDYIINDIDEILNAGGL
jgi:hypothetical protein